VITAPKKPDKLPITQDEEEDEKKDREEQQKENDSGEKEDKEKAEKNDEDEDDVDDDVEIPHDNDEQLQACDEINKGQCVYGKDITTIKQLAVTSGIKIIWIYIPSGTYLPTEEVIKPKPQPGIQQCTKIVSRIAGPTKVLLSELEVVLKGNPTLVCKHDHEMEVVKALKKARRRSFLERYKNNPMTNWKKRVMRH